MFSPEIIAERVEGLLKNYDFISRDTLAYFTPRLTQAPTDVAFALATIQRQSRAGQRVTVVLLPGAVPPALPAGVAVHRVPEDWSYEQLLEAVFEADHVTTW